MASASEGKPWTVDGEHRLLGLEVILLKMSYALPWSQFLYAEGTSEAARAVFTTHDVSIKGSGLASLFSDFARQQISVLKEPARSEKYVAASGPRITELTVRSVTIGQETS